MIKLKELLLKEENFQEEIPDILYHATFSPLLPKIKSTGILPVGDILHNYEDIEEGVYLASSSDYAISMVEASENKNIPEEWFDKIISISINTKKLEKSKFNIDPNVSPQEDEYDDSIPSDTQIHSYIYRGIILPSAFIGYDK